MNAYLSPEGIAAINAARVALQAKIEQKRRERRQAEEFAVALDGFKRCGWTGESAEELAHFQVYGTWK